MGRVKIYTSATKVITKPNLYSSKFLKLVKASDDLAFNNKNKKKNKPNTPSDFANIDLDDILILLEASILREFA